MGKAKCQHFGQCGGCKFQDIPYEEQLKNKEATVKELFPTAFHLPISPSPHQFYYRNRMDFAFGPNYSLGLKAGKFEIINIEKCWLTSEASNKILNRLRYFMQFKKLKGYIWGAGEKVRGPMRHVVIREGKNIKNTILNILTSDKVEFPLEELWEKIQDLVQGVTWSINLSPADRSYGEIQKSLGQNYITESLNNLKFKIPVQSFFQTNTHGAEKLIEIVRNFADPQGDEILYDLYSGTGSIGLSLADKAKEVIGIEENKAAVELSKANAELNDLKNYSAQAGRVEKLLAAIGDKASLVVLDPPRPGVHKKVLKKLGEIKVPKIVYVSCNPTTQKHDVEILKEFGYKIEKCQPLDMFPHTPHIENIISLIK
ncbi:23S rRNA (uracil(1939)-C(5))-methyltransferase RlmD [Candidatus Margulisiibacteriota bacterium]